MKKTLFGISTAALVAAAIAIPAIGASANDEPATAPQAASKIDGNGEAANPGGEAMVFTTTVNKSSPTLR